MAQTSVVEPRVVDSRSSNGLRRHGWSYAAAALFFALTVVSQRSMILGVFVESGDAAADSLRAEEAWAQTDGIFSRWGYHHPGPMLFWLEDLAERVLDPLGLDPFGAHAVMAAAMASVSVLALATALTDERATRWLGPGVFAVAALTFPQGVVVSPWAPTMGNWFFLLSVAGLIAAEQGRAWGYPVTVFGALGLVHLHMLFVPLGVMSLSYCVVLFVRRGPRGAPMGLALILAAALSLPIAVDAMLGESSWMAYLATGDESEPVAHRTLAATVIMMMRVITPSLVPGPAALLVLIGMVVLSAALLAVLREPGLRVSSFGALVGLGYVAAGSSVDFVIPGAFGVAPTLLFVATAGAVVLRVPMLKLRMGLVGVLLIVVAVIYTGAESVRSGRGDGTAEAAIATYRTHAGEGPTAQLAIDHSRDPWHSYADAASTALLAKRSGIEYCVEARRWPYWAMLESVCDPTRPRVMLYFLGDGAYLVSRLGPKG